MIEEWEDSLPDDMHLAYLPNQLTGVRLRLSTYTSERDAVDREIEKLKTILGDLVYSDRDDTLQECIGRLLTANGKTMSTAESCTGGMISQLITSISGSSTYFLGGVTSYANSVKNEVLGVDEEIINNFGAVSSECVAKMAEGVRKLTGSDFSVATSGIAGPGGGTPEKPVGLVWVGVSSDMGTETYKVQYNGDRKRNIERFSAFALNKLRCRIINELKY
jgi:nicotinamide-nucleotide amidase